MTPHDIHSRVAVLSSQLVKLDNRTKLDAKGSAVAKRRAKIVKDIDGLKAELPSAEQLDRRRRMLLLLCLA